MPRHSLQPIEVPAWMIDLTNASPGSAFTASITFPTPCWMSSASDLWRHLPGPSLFQLPGRHEPPLFISVLLHGNEDTGWRAVQTVLRRHREHDAAARADAVRRQYRGGQSRGADAAGPDRLQSRLARHAGRGHAGSAADARGGRHRRDRRRRLPASTSTTTPATIRTTPASTASTIRFCIWRGCSAGPWSISTSRSACNRRLWPRSARR